MEQRLIDANAFIDFIKDTIRRQDYKRLELNEHLTVSDVLDAVIGDLDGTSINGFENAPTIEAVPVRHGKFIGTEFDGYADGNPVYYEWKCSECGCVFEEEEPTYKYCPNCGAKME